MCRHEAAEALGALGDQGSLGLLKEMRDGDKEEVVRETCDIAVARIEWEHSKQREAEKLKQRYGPSEWPDVGRLIMLTKMQRFCLN